MWHKFLLSTLMAVLCLLPCKAEGTQMGIFDWFWGPSAEEEAVRQRALRDLDTIQSIFEVQYAPSLWKEEQFGWDLEVAIQEAKDKINALSYPTVKECQKVIRSFFTSTKDYHVGVHFFSTGAAALPFQMIGVEGRYFVVENFDINRWVRVGDEILTYDGRPIHEVVEEFRLEKFGDNHTATDRRLAESAFTFRFGSDGDDQPSGYVHMIVKRHKTNNTFDTDIPWLRWREEITDMSKCDQSHQSESTETSLAARLSSSRLPFYGMPERLEARKRVFGTYSGHDFGARESFIPKLGVVTWKTSSRSPFDAYIFLSPEGKKIGYVRIPSYSGGAEECKAFTALIKRFESETDALIVDQLNNPGGYDCYCYALASMLTQKPLKLQKEHLALTQEHVQSALDILSDLSEVQNTREAQECFGAQEICGFPVDYALVEAARTYAKEVIASWNAGKLYTDPVCILGEVIVPHKRACYTKPKLILINSLDMSCGDIMPTLLQDGQQATLLGTRTAGAGGSVERKEFPNQSGIMLFQLTTSLVRREDGRLIENKGCEPDIHYELTVDDLLNDYRGYVAKILESVEKIIQEQ